jgi:hypothetical protein
MPNPALTTDDSDYDAKAELTRFFIDRSVKALEDSIQHLCDGDFYKSVQTKLNSGVDLSDDLPELNINGMKTKTPAIIKKLHDEAMAAALNSWELKGGAAKVFNTTIRSHDSDDSNLPCFDVEYLASTDDGITKVNVKTWRRNVEVTVIGKPSAIEAASKQFVLAGMKGHS